MRFTKYVAAVLVVGFATTVHAADQNGYTAQFECRAGSPACNVDVNTYVSQSCQQTITTADSTSTIQSKINGGSQYVCVQPGDYTDKGTITISASGTAGARKVLRYTRGSDNGDHPAQQSDGNRAKFRKLILDGADYWILDRLALPSGYNGSTDGDRIFLRNTADNNIINRVLIEGAPWGSSAYYSAVGSGWEGSTSNRLTLQNSVIRQNWPVAGSHCVGIALESGSDHRIVNNEISNWCEHNVQFGNNGGPTMPGFVLENNDIYYTSDFAGYAEGSVEIKAKGTASNPVRVMQNRIWGNRAGNSSHCCDGGGGHAINVSDGTPFSYVLIQNNVLFDNQSVGLGWAGFFTSTNWSIIGNLFWNNRGAAMSAWSVASTEYYLNTVIGPGGSFETDNGSGSDFKCNVLIGAGAARLWNGTPSNYQADSNAFYDTPVHSYNGNGSYINKSLSDRYSNTNYNAGAVVRWEDSAQCTSGNEAGCFLYVARNTGTSGGSGSACTTLGCTFSDGAVTWQAIRGPHTVWRKQRTGAERVTIPYARVHTGAPEAYGCPSDFSARAGIGVNDER